MIFFVSNLNFVIIDTVILIIINIIIIIIIIIVIIIIIIIIIFILPLSVMLWFFCPPALQPEVDSDVRTEKKDGVNERLQQWD